MMLEHFNVWPLLWLSLASCSLLVALSPQLFGAIAEHGKTSVNFSSSMTQEGGFAALLAKTHERTRVPKSLFSVMYAFALICCLIPLYFSRQHMTRGVSWGHVLWDHPHILLLAVHCFRRLLECRLMTIYGRSKMHFSGFAVGLLHYAAVVACFSEVRISPSLHPALRWGAFLLFVIGNVMQHRFHIILYRIKQDQRAFYKLEREREWSRLCDHRRRGRRSGRISSSIRSVCAGDSGSGAASLEEPLRVHSKAPSPSTFKDLDADEMTTSTCTSRRTSPASSIGTSDSDHSESHPSRTRRLSSDSSIDGGPVGGRSHACSTPALKKRSGGSSGGEGGSRSGGRDIGGRREHRQRRKQRSAHRRLPSLTPPSSPMAYEYEVPRGSWFKYVCCPHYSAEIIVYMSFLLLAPTNTSLQGLLIWVISNLAVTGRKQLQWYQTNDVLRNDVPPHWCVLVPGVY